MASICRRSGWRRTRQQHGLAAIACRRRKKIITCGPRLQWTQFFTVVTEQNGKPRLRSHLLELRRIRFLLEPYDLSTTNRKAASKLRLEVFAILLIRTAVISVTDDRVPGINQSV